MLMLITFSRRFHRRRYTYCGSGRCHSCIFRLKISYTTVCLIYTIPLQLEAEVDQGHIDDIRRQSQNKRQQELGQVKSTI